MLKLHRIAPEPIWAKDHSKTLLLGNNGVGEKKHNSKAVAHTYTHKDCKQDCKRGAKPSQASSSANLAFVLEETRETGKLLQEGPGIRNNSFAVIRADVITDTASYKC